jgi:FkbH-like protein
VGFLVQNQRNYPPNCNTDYLLSQTGIRPSMQPANPSYVCDLYAHTNEGAISMVALSEPVRLVVWDLDETFWNGTLTEGGLRYNRVNHDIVVALAQRGIISSICSKNDVDKVRSVLEEHDVWKFFIFPSINWEPKGQRLACLIEAVQLRAESVMFIDDNPLNLAEAKHYLPEIQTAGVAFIPSMLNDARFIGKDDSGLTRLAQYKVLETRNVDQLAAGGDNRAFLKASDIRITIDYDVDAHIDRAVELVNRTNQLNFTKKRLPEDTDSAKEELRALVSRYDAFAGLIKVSDRYGDYGYVGFFVAVGVHKRSSLIHFCFSCRTLNMGIETWVYRWLGHPRLQPVGETLTDVANDTRPIDWITLTSGSEVAAAKPKKILDRLVLRGGCDLGALSHYLAHLAEEQYIEINSARDDRQIRIDHSAFLRFSTDGIGQQEQESLKKLGYVPADWESGLGAPFAPNARVVWILSFWVDSFAVLYKHRDLGTVVPFSMPKSPHVLVDVTALPSEKITELVTKESQQAAFDALKRDYVAIGKTNEEMLRSAMRKSLDKAGPNTQIFVMLGPESWKDARTGNVLPRPAEAAVNRWIRAELGNSPQVHLLEIMDFADPDMARSEALHFDRLVYKKVADAIRATIQERYEIDSPPIAPVSDPESPRLAALVS